MDELIRYARWDGSQDIELEYRSMLDSFMEKYMQTGDASFALEWMMREGVHMGSQMVDLAGLDRMMRQLRQQRSRKLSQMNPSGLTEKMRQMLEDIVEQELSTVRDRQQQLADGARPDPETFKQKMQEMLSREQELQSLPKKLRDAVESLKNYDFVDPEATARFQEFLEQMQGLMDFLQNNFFGSGRQMTMEEARELMRQVEKIDELIRALERGDLERLDLDALAEQLGEQSRRAIERFMQFSEFLKESGYVMDHGQGLDLSPMAMRKLGEKALSDIYAMLGQTPLGAHPSTQTGLVTPLPDQTKPLRFGEPFRPQLTKTLMNAIMRECSEGKSFSEGVRIKAGDFEVCETEHWSRSATALLLDMSLSMFQGGRFGAAKKVALALDQLIRSKFPRDYFYLIGFATTAKELTKKELLEAAGGLGEDIFTNIQDALMLSSRLLAKHRQARPQVILITDGQPTAFFLNGQLHIEWPTFGVAPESNKNTLAQVKKVTSQGITINTFMLDRQPALVSFVEEMTRINKGRAFFTSPDQLGKYLLLDFLGKRRKIIH